MMQDTSDPDAVDFDDGDVAGQVKAAKEAQTAAQRERVAGLLEVCEVAASLAARDVAGIYRYLQERGVTQRMIARLTEQSQSEIHEIIAGRKVLNVVLLERIADGLGVPRGRMGLAYVGLPGSLRRQLRAHGRVPDWKLWLRPPSTMLAAQQERPTSSRVDAATVMEATRAVVQPAAVIRGVPLWDGVHVRVLRLARRMSVREFAAHLGVSDRMVSKWEAGGVMLVPRPSNQAALDTSYDMSRTNVKERFSAAMQHPDVIAALQHPTANPAHSDWMRQRQPRVGDRRVTPDAEPLAK